MKKDEFATLVAKKLRSNSKRKPVSIPKQVFVITDDEGNSSSFVVKRQNKEVAYNQADVKAIIEAAWDTLADVLSQGEEVNFYGYGTFSLKHHDSRMVRRPDTQEWVEIPSTHRPKFLFGGTLKNAAKIYDLHYQDELERLELKAKEEEGEI